MRGRLWILYVVAALAATAGYYASGQAVRDLPPDRRIGGGGDLDRRRDLPAAAQAAVAPVRPRTGLLRRGRRDLVQLREVLRHGAAVPGDQRRALPGRLPVPDRGDPADRAPAQRRPRPRRPDRRRDDRDRHRRGVVGVPDRAVRLRQHAAVAGEGHRDGLPADGPAPDGGHRAAVLRRRAQAGQLLPARHGGRGAVRDRRDLRLDAAAQRLHARERPARGRVGLLLHPARRGGAPSVDAHRLGPPARGRHDGQHRSTGVPRRGVSARARDPGGRGGARTAGRSHRRLERHDRAVHPRGRPHGRAGAPAGAVGVARARAA